MPSIAAHMVCAKLVSEKLNITDPDFIKGNLLPDISLEKDSHKKIQGKHYYIPNINYFINTLDFSNSLYLGYLTHLLLDKYFLEDYIYDVVLGEEVFANKIMYKEYDNINYDLLNEFDVDTKYLNKILKNYNVPIDIDKYNKNIKCLNIGATNQKLIYLNLEHFSNFLINVSDIIVNELKGVIKNGSQFNMSYNRFR